MTDAGDPVVFEIGEAIRYRPIGRYWIAWREGCAPPDYPPQCVPRGTATVAKVDHETGAITFGWREDD